MIKAKEARKLRQEMIKRELKYCQEVAWPAIAPKLEAEILSAAKAGETHIKYVVQNPDPERISNVFNYFNCLINNLQALGYTAHTSPLRAIDRFNLFISWREDN